MTDAAMSELLASLLDAKAAPLTADDLRPSGQRQAEAMAEVFGYVADHGDPAVLPSAGGRRPHVNVLIRLEDLENRPAPPAWTSPASPPPPRCGCSAATRARCLICCTKVGAWADGFADGAAEGDAGADMGGDGSGEVSGGDFGGGDF